MLHLKWVNAANKDVALLALAMIPLLSNPDFDPKVFPHIFRHVNEFWCILGPTGQSDAFLVDDKDVYWHLLEEES